MVQHNEKINMVELAAQSVSKDLAFYILEYCTNPGMSFARLDALYGVPCSEATFYRHRTDFFRALRDIRNDYKTHSCSRFGRQNWNRKRESWNKGRSK